MNIQNYTIKSQEVLQRAQSLATELSHQSIEPSHLLKALLEIDENVCPYLLKKLGTQITYIESVIKESLYALPRVQGGQQFLSNDSQKVLQKAESIIKDWGDDFIALEHLLYALLTSKNKVSNLLKSQGLNPKEVEQAIKELRKGSKVESASAEDSYNALNKYARNLNQLAKDNKLDPVIGRNDEIRRVLQILSRRTKNNPILIGEPGVGKTAIAEGLAHRIIEGDIPENLKEKTIYSLDMGALVAGAKYKGEFEERLKSVVKEVIAADGDIILFIDEIHTLVGAGAGEGAMDAANILKPALARGDLRAVGATTLNEYQKYIEKDKALERRFQKVLVDEPDQESAIAILRGIQDKYETHHKVRIQDDAIISAVELSQRYISDRFLPDKAIDLIDEAASKIRLEINSKPEALDKIDRKIMQLEIEREAIKREKDEKRLKILKLELSDLNEERNVLQAKWQTEKDVVESIQQQKEEIENLKQVANVAEREGNFALVAEIRYGKIKTTEEKLESFKTQLAAMQSESQLIKEEVDVDDIADVVARWTGIPVSRMLQSEREKLLLLEQELHKRVIGQEEAITALSDAVRRSRTGLQDEKKPIGSFIFLGTTGVGKTELAKALANYLFNDENALTRIDMSEYQERHAVSRLVGAPPGYVGYDEGGQLTEAVRRKPYSVVLLDEIEKAHPDVFNILLQVLDDGRLTDNKGRLVNFKNTIIIMTSNMGAHIIQESFEKMNDNNRAMQLEACEAEVFHMLKQQIRPEFLNRIDEIIMFHPLNKKQVSAIVQMQFNFLKHKMSLKGIEIEATKEALEFISETGFNPQFGARPIKRAIQKLLLNKLSKELLGGNVNPDDPILIDCFDKEMVFRKQEINID